MRFLLSNAAPIMCRVAVPCLAMGGTLTFAAIFCSHLHAEELRASRGSSWRPGNQGSYLVRRSLLGENRHYILMLFCHEANVPIAVKNTLGHRVAFVYRWCTSVKRFHAAPEKRAARGIHPTRDIRDIEIKPQAAPTPRGPPSKKQADES